MSILRGLLLALLLVVSASAWSQVFWSVTDDDGNRSWLLGTVHSEDPRLLDFPDPLMDALQQADRVALELVPDAGMLARLREAMYYEEGSLEEVLEPDLYRRVVDILEENYGMGEPAVARMRPWAVAMTISVPPPETGLFMDLALSYRASGLGLEVVALETVDEQLDFLKGLSQHEQIALIRKAVADHEDLPELFEELIAAYLDGDLEGLERMSRQQLEGLDESVRRHFNEIGLKERNRIMLERATPWLEEGGVIIAVGALHLAGEHGLVNRLEQRGYELEGIY